MKRAPSGFELGHLEAELMQILWAAGELPVREAAGKLARPLAYTTVMTTLDRLFKKGFLVRRKAERAFVYRCRWTVEEWERKEAEHVSAALLDKPGVASNLLLSYLLDTVGGQDAALLDELERRVRLKKLELERRKKP